MSHRNETGANYTIKINFKKMSLGCTTESTDAVRPKLVYGADFT